jgi:acyl-coenzyme A synthetase/AMP-(fatty) acid ligase
MNLVDALFRHANERPDANAVVDGKIRLSWADLATRVEAVAMQLKQTGVAAGDRVALSATDGAHALIAACAALRLGAVHTPIDHALTGPEIFSAVSALAVPWIVTIDHDGHLRIAATGQAPTPDPLGAGQSAFLRCSSGTTGAAKGVLLSHRTIAERIACANDALQLTHEDRVLWLLPMAYHFAVSILLYIDRGAAIVFGNSLRASTTAAIARDEAVTMAYGSPYHIRRLASLPAGQDLPASLRTVIATTTALDATAAADFCARHGISVRQGLGIIEVGLSFVSPGGPEEKPGNLGKPLPRYHAAILDPNGKECAAGCAGELGIAGPGLFDAYVSPWRPRAELLMNGYFRSGDIAMSDASGDFHLLGRSKDVINVGGVKVFPLEVEAVLNAHPAVAASRVGSIADSRTGEQVGAEVQARPDADCSNLEQELAAWCAKSLAALKCPASIRIVDQLPMTGSGKVKRAQG